MLSEKRTQVLDITKQIRDLMLAADIKQGILLANSLHTTCALFVNEFQGALVEDLKAMVDRLPPPPPPPPPPTPAAPRSPARHPPRAPRGGPPGPRRGRRDQRRRAGAGALPVHPLRRAGRPP